MAKTIKFNLICDNKPCRTIEDLQENFSIEDVLDYYRKGLLAKWLSVRGFDEYLTQVESITSEDDLEIAKSLVRIFGLEIDEKRIEEEIKILKYEHEREELYKIYKKEDIANESRIEDFHTRYEQLVQDVIDAEGNMSKIKSAISEMVNKYYWLMKINRRELFYRFYYLAPKAVFVLLTHEKVRDWYLPVMIEKDGKPIRDIDDGYSGIMGQIMNDKKIIFNIIRGIIPEAKKILGDDLKVFAGCEKGKETTFWIGVKENSDPYMIISMQNYKYIRSHGKEGESLGYSDVTDKFVILNGIDYKSESMTDELWYMEV